MLCHEAPEKNNSFNPRHPAKLGAQAEARRKTSLWLSARDDLPAIIRSALSASCDCIVLSLSVVTFTSFLPPHYTAEGCTRLNIRYTCCPHLFSFHRDITAASRAKDYDASISLVLRTAVIYIYIVMGFMPLQHPYMICVKRINYWYSCLSIKVLCHHGPITDTTQHPELQPNPRHMYLCIWVYYFSPPARPWRVYS